MRASAFSRGWPLHTYVYRKTRRERGRAFLPSHYLFLALSLSSSSFLVSLASLSLSLSRPSSTDHVREGILSSFYSLSRPVIVDTMGRNDCFTPPLARELGNKLAAGLISLSRSMTAPPRLRRQGLMSKRVSRPDAGLEDTVKIRRVPAHRRINGSACSLAQSAASLKKTGHFRLKRGAGTPRLRESAIATLIINPRREDVSGKWREQCHNLLRSFV